MSEWNPHGTGQAEGARRRLNRLIIFAAGLALGLPASANAAERLVTSPKGLKTAIKEALPGDSIILKDGEWRDLGIAFHANGTPAFPITLRPETLLGAKLTGNSWIRMHGRHLVVEGLSFEEGYTEGMDVIQFREDSDAPAEFCRLTRCQILYFNPPSGDTGSHRWVRMDGISNRVDHCYFLGKNNEGATLIVEVGEEPNGNRIDHNHFGPRPELGKNGGETIRVGTSPVSMNSSGTLIEENLFEECNGEAETISIKSCDNVCRNNTFRRCSGTLTLRHGERNRVEGNIFLGERQRGTGGIRVIGADHVVINNYLEGLEGDDARAGLCIMLGQKDPPAHGYFQVKHALIACNTLIDCKESLSLAYGYKDGVLPPEYVTFAGNLVHCPERTTRLLGVEALLYSDVHDNFVVGILPEELPSGLGTFDVLPWKRESELLRPVGKLPEAAGLKEKVLEDLDGQPRKDRVVVGCDEPKSAASRQPLTPEDVGPKAK